MIRSNVSRSLGCITLAVLMLCSLCACGGSSAPNEVQEYADKHDFECFTPNTLAKKGIVGEKYVVWGTVSYIFFADYAKGSQSLEDFLSNAKEEFRGAVEASVVDTMRYSIELDDCAECDIKYEDFNFTPNQLKINEGDEVAFVVLCEDGLTAGSYDYTIIEKIWESRTSETTVEEDFAENNE